MSQIGAPDFLAGDLFATDGLESWEGVDFPEPDAQNDKVLTDEQNDAMRTYMLNTARFGFSRFINNRTSMPYGAWNGGLWALKLRNYARYGFYDINQYLEKLVPGSLKVSTTRTGANTPSGAFAFAASPRKSSDLPNAARAYMNINLAPYPLLPSLMNKALWQIMGQKYRPEAFAVDSTAQVEKEYEKQLLLLEFHPAWMQFKEQAQALGAQPPNPAEQFSDKGDVEAHFELDQFKLQREIDIVDLLITSLQESGWDAGIAVQLIEDVLTLNKCATETYTDPADNIPRVKYLDAANVFCRLSNYDDNRDVDYVWVLERMTLSDLRRYNHITEKELKEIIQRYQGQYNNQLIATRNDQWGRFYNQYSVGLQIPEYKFNIMRGYFIASVKKNFTKIKRANGTMSFKEVGDDYVLSEKSKAEGKELVTSTSERLFQCSWVIDTDIVFDYGYAKNVPYKTENGLKRPVMPISVYSMQGTSFVEKGVTFQDDVNIDLYKMRQAKIKMIPPPGLIVSPKALSNVDIGTGELEPRDVMDLLQESGTLYADDMGDYNQRNSNSAPIKPISDNGGAQIAMWQATIANSIAMCKEHLGITGVVDTSQQPAKKAVGVAELELQGTNNALKPYQNAYLCTFNGSLENLHRAWKVQASRDPRKIKYQGVDTKAFREIAIGKDIADSEFGIYVNAALEEQEIQNLLQLMTEQKQLGIQSNGSSGIDAAQFLYVYQILKDGNIKKATKAFAEAVRQNKKHALLMAQQNSEQNSKTQQDSISAKMQADIQMMQLKGQIDDQGRATQGKIDAMLLQIKQQGEDNRAAAKNHTTLVNTMMDKLGNAHSTEMKHEHEKLMQSNTPPVVPPPMAPPMPPVAAQPMPPPQQQMPQQMPQQ